MSSLLKNVIVIGAGGNLGPSILSALSSNPSFTVTVLSRSSSKSTFPSSVTVNTISDTYPPTELIAAFKGQDAIIDLAPLNIDHKPFIDTAVEAGVKRYIPAEFGSKTNEPRVNELVPAFQMRVEVAEYLKSKESTGLTWTGISCGAFFDWGLRTLFLGFDLPSQKATIYDSGDAKADVSLLSEVGRATASVLSHPAETTNRYVYVNSFFTSQNEILAALEKASGKKWQVEKASAAESQKVGREKLLKGDFSGFAPAIMGLIYSGQEWVHGKGADNGFLGVGRPIEDLEEVVAKIVKGEEV